MAIKTANWGQNASYSADDFRRIMSTHVVPGVFERTDFEVSRSGSNLYVTAGRAVVASAAAVDNPYYLVESNATTGAANSGTGTRSWTINTSGTPRTDVIYLVVNDSSSLATADVRYEYGVSTPTENHTLTLATITSASSNVTSLDDKRVFGGVSGGMASYPTTGALPTSGYWSGQRVYCRDEDVIREWTSGARGWTRPWHQPWGVVATGSFAPGNITSGWVTYFTTTAVTTLGRKLEMHFTFWGNAGDNAIEYHIEQTVNGSTTTPLYNYSQYPWVGGFYSAGHHFVVDNTSGGGAQWVFKAHWVTTTGSILGGRWTVVDCGPTTP